MTTVVAIVAAYMGLLTLGCLWFADRQAQRQHAQASPDLVELIALVDRLCQRVQAPERAVFEHAVAAAEDDPVVEAVNMFDDRDYWESKDALAQREFEEELTGG